MPPRKSSAQRILDVITFHDRIENGLVAEIDFYIIKK